MRFMILFRANADSEAGVLLSEKLLTEMGVFTDELVSAGIMKVGEGLHPSSKAKRITFTNHHTTGDNHAIHDSDQGQREL